MAIFEGKIHYISMAIFNCFLYVHQRVLVNQIPKLMAFMELAGSLRAPTIQVQPQRVRALPLGPWISSTNVIPWVSHIEHQGFQNAFNVHLRSCVKIWRFGRWPAKMARKVNIFLPTPFLTNTSLFMPLYCKTSPV